MGRLIDVLSTSSDDGNGSTPKKARTGRPMKNVTLNAAFARRLQVAIDNNPNVPPKFHGQAAWFVGKFAERGVPVSIQTVSGYLQGKYLPAPDKLAVLAGILNVDESWLLHGDPISAHGRVPTAPRNPSAPAIVNLLAGMIGIDGGAVAFADEDSSPDNAHMFAIIRGVQYSIRAIPGEIDGDDVVITFNRKAPMPEHVLLLAVVRKVAFEFGVFEITPAIFEQYARQGHGRGPSEMRIPTAEVSWIESFKQRL